MPFLVQVVMDAETQDIGGCRADEDGRVVEMTELRVDLRVEIGIVLVYHDQVIAAQILDHRQIALDALAQQDSPNSPTLSINTKESPRST